MHNASPAELLASLPEAERQTAISELSIETQAYLAHYWQFWARPDQLLPDGDWTYWLILAGRGWGKTRTGAEAVRTWIKTNDIVNLIGATVDDARDIMIEGESGILATCPDNERPEYRKTERKLIWPNGAVSLIFTADEPERLRGKQHKKLWCFTALTRIATPTGERSICKLLPGDMVSTRFGPRRVSAISRDLGKIGRVRFSTGAELIGTSNHPVLTSDGWMMLGDLQECQTVFAGRPRAAAISAPTSDQSSAASEPSFISTDGFGNRSAGQFLPALISTTSTAIRPTIGLRTLSASLTAYIERFMRRVGTTLARLLSPLSSLATIAGPVSFGSIERSNAYVQNAVQSGQKMRVSSSESANVAEPCSDRGVETFAASVVSTWADVGEDTVYNLMVEDAHEFIANGIVVHNCDEMASWRYQESWDQAKFGLRLGENPQAIITTTPRPVKNITQLLHDKATRVTRGTTYDNRANLAPSFFAQIVQRYEGTRLGRQELNAEVLLDVPGALWTRESIQHLPRSSAPMMQRIVVGVDPSITSKEGSDECGIVVDGIDGNGNAYCFADRSGVLGPRDWARAAVLAFREFEADLIVAEANQGGEMVRQVITSFDPSVPVKLVHASRGKYIRAEPISALYARGIVYHLGSFEALEDQMCTFTPDFDRSRDGSPDRLDAHVWAMTELFPSLTLMPSNDDEDNEDAMNRTRSATTGY